jgi:putative flippase GtrA
MSITQQPRFFSSFVRSQISSVVATASDFAVLITLTEVVHLWYLFSVFFGAVTGGTVAFFLGRNWAFTSKNGHIWRQALRYLLIWVSNIVLTVSGVYCLVHFLEVKYVWAKVIVATVVGILFSFPMQRYFVYVFNEDDDDELV